MEKFCTKGYGRVSKTVILDPNLSLTAKAIYSVLCLYRNLSAYPSRDGILKYLGITENTYYKAYRELKKADILSADQQIGKTFARNFYTFRDSFEKGYGLVYREVLCSDQLSAKAKGLYAMLCVFAGGEQAAYPKLEILSYYSGVSEETLRKYVKELKTGKIVVVCPSRKNGRYSANTVYVGCAQNSVTEPKESCVLSKKCGTEKQSAENCGTVKNKTQINKKENKNIPLAQLEALFGRKLTPQEIRLVRSWSGWNMQEIALAYTCGCQNNAQKNNAFYLNGILRNIGKEKLSSLYVAGGTNVIPSGRQATEDLLARSRGIVPKFAFAD